MTSQQQCSRCKNKLSDTIQDNRGKGWEFGQNMRVCNHCYLELLDT